MRMNNLMDQRENIEKHLYSRMEQSTLASGIALLTNVTEEEPKFGLTVQDMKDTGLSTKPTEKVD
jgi:hypothetical protein